MNLTESLRNRQEQLSCGKELVRRTRSLFDTYGEGILTASYGNFDRLEKSLDSKEVRIVVVGEYSRGKSSLLNALLNTEQLPTAEETTTSTNTFVYGLSENVPTPCIEIVFSDNSNERKRIDIKDEEHSALLRWGTELDKENSKFRKSVDHINFFMDHPMLNLGLVLIDTPGLESMQEHHEEITLRAIDTAHIAIWVQSTDQLGGNRKEWDFMRGTIHKNFRKFLTVVNRWDRVHDTQDRQDKDLPIDIREKKKMDVVRDSFREALKGVASEDEISVMVSEDNLFGVSARWALSGDEELINKSRIYKLAERIRQICTGEEARQEIFYAPMKKLLGLQDRLKNHLTSAQAALETKDSLEQQKKDCEKLENDIKLTEREMKLFISEAKEDHARVRDSRVKKIMHEIANPLHELQQDIDNQVSPDYVREQIRKRSKSVVLPPKLDVKYREVLTNICKKWAEQRKDISSVLEELRIKYEERMNKHIGELSATLKGLDINMPKLDVRCNVNYSNIEEYYSQKNDLQKRIDSYEDAINENEENIAALAPDTERLDIARSALDRAERNHAVHGTQPPPPIMRQEVQKESRGVFLDFLVGQKQVTVNVPDYTNVKAWQEEKNKLEADVCDREAEVNNILQEEREKRTRRLSLEMQNRRREQMLKKSLTEKNALDQKLQQEIGTTVERAHRELLNKTSGIIGKYVRMLEENVEEWLGSVFDNHLFALESCMTEEFMEPLRSKKACLDEALRLFEQGKADIEERKRQLQTALQELADLQRQTSDCLAR